MRTSRYHGKGSRISAADGKWSSLPCLVRCCGRTSGLTVTSTYWSPLTRRSIGALRNLHRCGRSSKGCGTERLWDRNVDLVEKRLVEQSENYIRREHILEHARLVYVA